ncbi:TIGR04086 family membrane protein [Alkalibaculum bacchi]|uniref:TIGR04086 family membrane protein n=1 Tax=Alkalibaculum bacchi TaxID=645887 RepID=UPI0026ECD8EC|nr:TIGR04086 family membrane protein [Alkalibaculum bacchi]
MKENSQVDNEFLKLYLKGLLRSIGLALILIVIMTTVFFFVDLNNNLVNPFEFVILLLSVLYASIYVSRRMKSKGWLHGIIMGTIYFAIIFAVNLGTAADGFQIMSILPKWIFFASTGFIGGCIGVNIR